MTEMELNKRGYELRRGTNGRELGNDPRYWYIWRVKRNGQALRFNVGYTTKQEAVEVMDAWLNWNPAAVLTSQAAVVAAQRLRLRAA